VKKGDEEGKERTMGERRRAGGEKWWSRFGL